MIRSWSRFTFLLCLMLTLGSSAFATTFVRVADSDLADGSSTIVEVEILDAYSVSGHMPTTEISMAVRRVLKGDVDLAHQSQIALRVPGGLDPVSGLQLKVFGTPELRRGARALVFLQPSHLGKAVGTDVAFGLHHGIQGFFHVAATPDGQWVAYRNFGQAEEIQLSGRKNLAPEGPRDLDAFSQWLENRAAGLNTTADYRTQGVDLSTVIRDHRKYTLLRPSGGGPPIRWQDFDSGNVNFFSTTGGQPGLPSGGHSETRTAINAWVNDGGSNVRYVYAGQTGASGGLSNFDDINAIQWDDPAGVIGTPFNCGTGGTIASGGAWWSTSITHSAAGGTYTTALGGDIVTNKGINCWISLNNRAAEVFAHEIGHTLGIGHSCDLDAGNCSNNTRNEALMRAQAHGDGRGASLNSDDRAAARFLYRSNSSAPSAPSNLTASALDESRVQLSWTDNSGNESTFRIERRTGGGSFSEIGSVGANVRSYTDSSVSSGSSYDYRVFARNTIGDSGDSNTASVSTPGAPAPSNLTVTILSATSARVSWTDNATGENGYEVQSNGFGVYFPAASTDENAQTALLTGLNPETEYTFRVRAVGGTEGNSSYSVVGPATTEAGAPEPCVTSDTAQCLSGGRFRVQLGWRNGEDVTGVANAVDVSAVTNTSGLFWFFDQNNWEVLVKVLDGCVLNNHFWVFAAATTDLEYNLLVIDHETGNGVVYQNPLGTASAAVTDSEALTCGIPVGNAEDPVSPTLKHVLTTDPSLSRADIGELDLPERATSQAEPKACAAGQNALCLTGNRFLVEVDWMNQEGDTGDGTVVNLPVVADDSGLFWFFFADNWEMLVKVLDGCVINNHYWVYAAATTNVEYSLRVTDTETGLVQTYFNPLGVSSPAITDVEAFATCP